MRPLYPFFIAGGVVFYGVAKLQGKMLQSAYILIIMNLILTLFWCLVPEYANDPKNPYAAANKKADHH